MHANPAEGGGSLRADNFLAAAKRVSGPLGLGLVVVAVVWWWHLLAVSGAAADWAFDFRQFWAGAHAVVNGVSPYPDPAAVAKAGQHLDADGIQRVFLFPYPAGAAVAIAPLGLLTFHAAAAVWSALLIVSLFGGLAILGVRDWRVLAVVVTSFPVLSSVRLGSFTPVLILLLAIVWRWRDRSWLAGGALALAIAFKLFLWPLAFWLVVTRRFRAAALSFGLAVAATLVAWAAIGFAGFSDYPDLVRRLTDVVEGRGFSLVALGLDLGLPHALASLLLWVVGVSLLGWVFVSARRGGDERLTFSVAMIASIALTPIVWLHYFALLIVPLALFRPKFAWVWLVMWVFWLIPDQSSEGELWRVLLAAALTIAVIVQGAWVNGRRATV